VNRGENEKRDGGGACEAVHNPISRGATNEIVPSLANGLLSQLGAASGVAVVFLGRGVLMQ